MLAPALTYDSNREGSAGLRAALVIRKAPQVGVVLFATTIKSVAIQWFHDIREVRLTFFFI